jgi:type II secretion system protein H
MQAVSSFVIRHSNFRGRRRGFTLLELILVMAIIALTIAIAVPSLSGFARARVVSDTAAHFTAMASLARNHAVAEGQPYRLVIDLPNRLFSITKGSGDGQTFVQADLPDAKPFNLPKDLDMSTDAPEVDGQRIIEFQPEGRTDIASVEFTDRFGNKVDVRCDSTFGYYKIVSGPDAVAEAKP